MSEPVDFVASTGDGKIYPKTVGVLVALKKIDSEDGNVNAHGTEMNFPNVADYVVGDTVYFRADCEKRTPIVLTEVGEGFAGYVYHDRSVRVCAGELAKEPIGLADVDAAQARLEAKYG